MRSSLRAALFEFSRLPPSPDDHDSLSCQNFLQCQYGRQKSEMRIYLITRYSITAEQKISRLAGMIFL